jgi:hypothetical protein
MTQSSTNEPRFEIKSSRIWALLTFKVTRLFFPARMFADSHGVSTMVVTFWMTPWIREDDHLPMSHIAEVGHDRGFIWDTISVESSGGLNPLTVTGLPKGQANDFVAHVRQMNR